MYAIRSYYALATAPVYAGETARFRLALTSERARAGLVLEHGGQTGTALDLDAGEAGELALDLAQPRRGWHSPDRLTLAPGRGQGVSRQRIRPPPCIQKNGRLYGLAAGHA